MPCFIRTCLYILSGIAADVKHCKRVKDRTSERLHFINTEMRRMRQGSTQRAESVNPAKRSNRPLSQQYPETCKLVDDWVESREQVNKADFEEQWAQWEKAGILPDEGSENLCAKMLTRHHNQKRAKKS